MARNTKNIEKTVQEILDTDERLSVMLKEAVIAERKKMK